MGVFVLIKNIFYDATIIFPDSIPPSDRRWLLVARSADFADVGPTVACQPLFMLDFSIFCRRWIFIQDGGEQ